MKLNLVVEKAISGDCLSREESLAVLRWDDSRILELLEAAFQVRKVFFGRRVAVHLLLNAKSGLCPEDCAYCSQSSISEAAIERYPLLDVEAVLQGARASRQAQAVRYCIVTSGRDPTPHELQRLCGAVRRIKSEVDISVCVSLGFLTPEMARALKEAGVDRYNHNLNASRSFYSRICTTHSYGDRLQTLHHARRAGLELCSGALFGLGETEEDIVDLALALRELHPDSLPVNFYHPIPGTPLEKAGYLTPLICLKILCLIRFLSPRTEVRIAGGREFHLRTLQPLAFYPANSIFVGGYLTTPGQQMEEARQMIQDAGFEVEVHPVGEVAAGLQP